MKKRLIPFILILVALGIQILASPAEAGQRRRRGRRTVVVVHKNFPIRRPLRQVYVRPLVRPFRIAPRIYLPLFIWPGTVAAVLPPRDLYVWEDAEMLAADDDWTELTLNCENTGTKLWLEIVSGRARFDWAEVVFENGETQVVEMQEFSRDPGFYPLLDFAGGRMVDHVRLVAKSETPETKVVLRIQK